MANKPGITNMTYNKRLRMFETTLTNGSKGPDISLDAIIVRDNTVSTFQEKLKQITAKKATIHSKAQSIIKTCDATTESYNTSLEQMSRLVDDIEGLVNK